MTHFDAQSGFEEDLLNSVELQLKMAKVAMTVHRAALSRAQRHRRTGNYINNLVIENHGRSVFAIHAKAYYSNWIEYGTGSRRLGIAPTPCPHQPQETGVHPQLIMIGAIMDVTR